MIGCGPRLALVLGFVIAGSTSCASHRSPGNTPALADVDPLSGEFLELVHSHSHGLVEVLGTVTCSGTCDFAEVQVFSKRYVDKGADLETRITVDAYGHFQGTLPISWGSTGSATLYFPAALVFSSPGCHDAIVAVSTPWRAHTVKLQCN